MLHWHNQGGLSKLIPRTKCSWNKAIPFAKPTVNCLVDLVLSLWCHSENCSGQLCYTFKVVPCYTRLPPRCYCPGRRAINTFFGLTEGEQLSSLVRDTPQTSTGCCWSYQTWCFGQGRLIMWYVRALHTRCLNETKMMTLYTWPYHGYSGLTVIFILSIAPNNFGMILVTRGRVFSDKAILTDMSFVIPSEKSNIVAPDLQGCGRGCLLTIYSTGTWMAIPEGWNLISTWYATFWCISWCPMVS
jgi:hypothetical protein